VFFGNSLSFEYLVDPDTAEGFLRPASRDRAGRDPRQKSCSRWVSRVHQRRSTAIRRGGNVGAEGLEIEALAARAAAARARAQLLRSEVERLQAASRRTLGECLVVRTTRLDTGRGTDVDRYRMHPLSRAVGRDPVIEDAKQVLADRHAITSGQAFELLRHISQHKNRKLRDVARAVVTESEQNPTA
jgi:hypothetical protein